MKIISILALLVAATTFSIPAHAERVDLQLVLAIDISGSIDAEEARLQRDGYTQALTHPAVLAAIHSGPLKRIAVTYLEWAGDPYQSVVADWAIIDDAASAKRFADEVASQPIDRAQWTSISAAIRFASQMFKHSPHRSRRRAIDISGDGANNHGAHITAVRERAIAAGIVINGLPIINGRQSRHGLPPLPYLSAYYRECVIGGPGSFLIVANGFKDFARAIRRKLILEIAGHFPPSRPTRAPGPRLILADYHKPRGDCSDGEWWLEQHFEDY
jgi:hypothetical protein